MTEKQRPSMERTLFNAKTAEDVDFCLDRGDNIEITNGRFGCTPFIYYCREGNIDVVVRLINRGCDINIRYGGHFYIMNGMEYVCINGHYDLLVELLKFPQVRNLINSIGKTSTLGYACYKGLCDIVDILLENGADVNHRDECGRTPLYIALSNGNPIIVRKLLDTGADVNAVDNDNCTCIHNYSITLECLDIVLCYGGLNLINKQDDYGYTPLHIAIQAGNIAIIPRLLDCCADPNIPDMKGITPLEYAKSTEFTEVIELINR